MGFSKARFVLRRQTVSDPFRVQKHFLGAGILRARWTENADVIDNQEQESNYSDRYILKKMYMLHEISNNAVHLEN